ncbi:DUF4169 family protein [uncultured Albimonas sp.]|uniref:DUF4169 family protein n=1 Tax=uncultured Albimonas sp. TaxID=1331701 RepID=UPI0030EDCD53|tara:strand:- start:1697 stop:1951 length:255 start_codon:yes stop_codon:yes gene_type:complete
MAEIINLRRARKQRGRDARRKEGDANAARHGRTAADKAQEAAQDALARRRLDGHRLEERDAPDAGEGGEAPDAETRPDPGAPER